MPAQPVDKELKAIRDILGTLQGFAPFQRRRVLDYVRDRLEDNSPVRAMAGLEPPPAGT